MSWTLLWTAGGRLWTPAPMVKRSRGFPGNRSGRRWGVSDTAGKPVVLGAGAKAPKEPKPTEAQSDDSADASA